MDESELLRLAASIERGSESITGRGHRSWAQQRNLRLAEAEEFQPSLEKGLSGESTVMLLLLATAGY
jgi:hypothetical protein